MTYYEDMPLESKVWIYQSDRDFRDAEVQGIRQRMREFMEEWSAHGDNLKAFGDVYYNRFLVIMVDESVTVASGCSIDKSVHLIKEISNAFDVDLFDRLPVAYMQGSDVHVVSKKEFLTKVDNSELDEQTLIFNNLVNTKSTFETLWKVPLKEHYLSKVVV